MERFELIEARPALMVSWSLDFCGLSKRVVGPEGYWGRLRRARREFSSANAVGSVGRCTLRWVNAKLYVRRNT